MNRIDRGQEGFDQSPASRVAMPIQTRSVAASNATPTILMWVEQSAARSKLFMTLSTPVSNDSNKRTVPGGHFDENSDKPPKGHPGGEQRDGAASASC
jgi:hypothetical protein